MTRRYLLYSLLFLGLLLNSCTNENDDAPLPPSEWMVIGNDLGFRNEFVDMANVVRLTDSTLTVFSVAYPDVELNFPIRDSVVMGNADKQWRMSFTSVDTLILHDTLQKNRYHLLRLKNYEPVTSVWRALTSNRFTGRYYDDHKTFVFEGLDSSAANCYVAHLIQTSADERRKVRLQDGYWRLDQRFSQPILLYTLGQGDHYVTLLDSVDAVHGLQGQLIINSRPDPDLNRRDTLWPVEETLDIEEMRSKITQLDFTGTSVRPMLDPARDTRWRISWSGKELQEVLSVNDFEVGDLRFFLEADNYYLNSGDQALASGKFSVHPRYPYLVLDGSCGNDYYLPIKLTENQELEIMLPLRIRLPDQEVRHSGIGEEVPDRVAYSENAVIFTVPFTTDIMLE